MSFPDVVMTHELQHSELGKPLQSVKLGNKPRSRKPGFFVDRLDHSHTFIRPHLARGSKAILTGTSTLACLPGNVGELGLDKVAGMNAGHDSRPRFHHCDPEKAMKRINRMPVDDESKQNTSKHRKFKPRSGKASATGDLTEVPPPFNQCFRGRTDHERGCLTNSKPTMLVTSSFFTKTAFTGSRRRGPTLLNALSAAPKATTTS